MSETPNDLVSISEAARKIGVNKSTLARQLKSSGVAQHDGKVSYSDVLAFRASAIDLTRSRRGAGLIDGLDDDPLAAKDAPVNATADATIGDADATAQADATVVEADGVIVDGAILPYAVARALKETYLARLKRLEYETKRGELAPVAAMFSYSERMFGVVRERLLAIPGKLSGDLDDDQAERLTAELYEALEDMHAQGAAAEALGAARAEDDDGDEGA